MKAPAAIALLVLLGGCARSESKALAAASPTPAEDLPATPDAPPLPDEGAPRVRVAIRAGLVPGRPVPFRVVLENRTRDVLVPISVEASDGSGGAAWGRSVAGEVTYDAESDRFEETPVRTLTPIADSGDRVLFRSALFPGETLVQDVDVRYGHSGLVEEKLRVLYHRLAPAEFERRCYVSSGEGIPRRYIPVGLVADRAARRGALLAGFYLRAQGPPESAYGTITLTLPGLPPAVSTRIEKAGFDPERAMAADWAGGWLAGDEERSVLVTPAGGTRPLWGVPFDALQVIDDAGSDVSFCITGARREEITPLFPGREIVPYKCLHVSVPRTDILATLERLGSAGFAVKRVDFEMREALDVRKAATPPPRTPAIAPKASPSPGGPAPASPTPTRAPRTPAPSPSPPPAVTAPAATATPAPTVPATPVPEATPETPG